MGGGGRCLGRQEGDELLFAWGLVLGSGFWNCAVGREAALILTSRE